MLQLAAMMGKRTMYVLTAVSLLIALLQLTPLAFLSKDVSDGVWGFTVGLGIGALVVWATTRRVD
jgi:hypothetical protein